MAIVTISEDGAVVIPQEIRERYGWKPGDQVHIIDFAGSVAIVSALKDPIREARGMFKGGPSMTKELLEERRREREREERDLPPPRRPEP